MKRILFLAMACITIINASAQKKEIGGCKATGSACCL